MVLVKVALKEIVSDPSDLAGPRRSRLFMDSPTLARHKDAAVTLNHVQPIPEFERRAMEKRNLPA